MGCKGSKQLEVENTYGELNKNIQKMMMLREDLILASGRMVFRWDYLKRIRETSRPLVMRDCPKGLNLCQLYKRQTRIWFHNL